MLCFICEEWFQVGCVSIKPDDFYYIIWGQDWVCTGSKNVVKILRRENKYYLITYIFNEVSGKNQKDEEEKELLAINVLNSLTLIIPW